MLLAVIFSRKNVIYTEDIEWQQLDQLKSKLH